jgi:hypothetical protein
MPRPCPTCRRVNPPQALFCYHDGSPLRGHGQTALSAGGQAFPAPLVFPSGRTCTTFNALTRACLDEWSGARFLLRKGTFQTFLAGMGRLDLAEAARKGAAFPDPDRGLDQFLASLPGPELPRAQLRVEPAEVDLGGLALGRDRSFAVRLVNGGSRLLHGSVACPDSVWLLLGGPDGGTEKHFKFVRDLELAVHVRGDSLRASPKSLEAHLLIDSNGGSVTVTVRAAVPVKPFPAGVLVGAVSPRQLAETSKDHPREAAALFESGAVAAWYKTNGWTYPVQGPTSSGLAAVQQFFESLGLTQPPRLRVNRTHLELSGAPGQVLRTTVRVETEEKRPIYVHGRSNQPWLQVDPVVLRGRAAEVPVSVEMPGQPGEQRTGVLTLVGNGNQRFRIPVTVTAARSAPAPGPRPPRLPPVAAAVPPAPSPASPIVQGPSSSPSSGWGLLHLAPVALLVGVAAALVVGDALLPNRQLATPNEVPVEETVRLDPEPWLELQLHDGKKDERFDGLPPPLLGTFGLQLAAQTGNRKDNRLTFDRWGRTNNVCLWVDDRQVLLGDPDKGSWEGEFQHSWLEEGKERQGMKGIWQLSGVRIRVTQLVNMVPGQVQWVDGRLVRHQDTCLVRYRVDNVSDNDHRVGLRFLLDTFIGSNDGVPFVIEGSAGLCSSFKDFKEPKDVPDYILAQEGELPEKPGTIVNLRFKLPEVGKPPDRVTLGAWPVWELPGWKEVAQGHRTGWNVPVVSMQATTAVQNNRGEFLEPDSAVTMYWNPARLGPGETRKVGFAYGLGRVAGDAAPSQLRVVGGGVYQVGAEFSIQALVRNPAAGQALTVELPVGLELVRGPERQEVPPVHEGAARPESTVTWIIKGTTAGTRTLTVRSSTGVTQPVPIVVKSKLGIFD